MHIQVDMELTVQERTIIKKKTKKLRQESMIPAVLYGGKALKNVSVSAAAFTKVYREAGESALVDLRLGDSVHKVLIKHVARAPVSGSLLHIDFQEVNMSKKIKAQIPIQLNGEPPAVKELGAVLVHLLDHLEVECLPQDLIHEFPVNVQGLAKVGDALRIRDLSFPPSLHVFTKPETVVVLIELPKVEEEAPAIAAQAPDLAKVVTEQEEKRAAAQAKAAEEKSIEG